MNVLRLFLVVSLAFVLGRADGIAQYKPTTIESIVTNPGNFADGAVEISGTVTLYAAARPPTGYYLLKGASGTAIRVNTTEGSPELTKKYRVTGVVYLEPTTRIPFISEKSRVREDSPPQTSAPAAAENEYAPVWTWLLPILLLVFLGIVLFLVRRRRQPALPSAGSAVPEPAPPMEEALVLPPSEPVSDLKTVRIVQPSAMTMRYVPGELVVLSGEDQGKSFKIAGYPTPEGSIVTIGREPVADERAYAHIQIEERFHTVSRKQAELIWKEKKLFVKNLSDTNPTQVNGVEIKAGKTVQLKAGSVLRTGELEFEYRV